MTIEEDLKTIEELQEKFKKDHGTFFEMDWAEQKIDVPKAGDTLNLTKIKRFIGSADARIYPDQKVKEILFVPTTKDWRFCIGRGIQRDEKGNLIRESWHCTRHQKSADGKITTVKIIGGGDEHLLKADGMIE